MSKSMWKLLGPDGATVEITDTAGVAALLLNGVQVVGAQGAAITSITDNSGGTGTDTIAAIGATYDQDEVRNAVASLSDKLEEVLGALRTAGLIAS